MHGCIKEESSDCNFGVNVSYAYTKNPDGTNKFGSEVKLVALYIFDKDDRYVGSIVERGSQLTNDFIQKVVLPEKGVYSFVAWCGGNEKGDYEIVRKCESGFDKTLVAGSTKLSDMRMRVCEDKNGVIDTEINDLYFGSLHRIEVKTDSRYEQINIDLVKNTNTINLSMTGFAPAPAKRAAPSGYQVTIGTIGGVYNFDNTVDKVSSSPYTYKHYKHQADGQTLTHSLKTLRLLTDREMKLSITDAQAGTTVLSPTNVVAMIMQNPAYNTQDALDREDTYNISFTKNTDVTIDVNGWTIVDTDIEIK